MIFEIALRQRLRPLISTVNSMVRTQLNGMVCNCVSATVLLEHQKPETTLTYNLRAVNMTPCVLLGSVWKLWTIHQVLTVSRNLHAKCLIFFTECQCWPHSLGMIHRKWDLPNLYPPKLFLALKCSKANQDFDWHAFGAVGSYTSTWKLDTEAGRKSNAVDRR